MRAIGVMTTIAVVIAGAVAASFAWKSRGDVRRYLKIRSM
jgi:hypothetical protein